MHVATISFELEVSHVSACIGSHNEFATARTLPIEGFRHYFSAMTSLALLWLPILLSAVFVFIVSSVIHMALPVHKNDYRGTPNEDGLRAALRDAKIPPGQYMFPHANSFKEAMSPEMTAKFEEGPVGILIMRPNGMMKMGGALTMWFFYCILIGVFVAYLTGFCIAPGGEGVFRIAATVALLGHAFTSVNDSIWKSISWRVTLKFVGDGVAYALVTGATFAWLWPAA
mgnify:FL=1|tara:strand:+ start:7021 stop:7704 length:684 start_codon:yes stop_codon:yes gene_type:complete